MGITQVSWYCTCFNSVRQKLNKIFAPKWLMKAKAHYTHDVDSEKFNVETEKFI